MKLRLLLFAILTVLILPACNEKQDDSPVSMLITQGFSESYYKSLAKDVKKDLGIDIEFRYEISANQSTLLLQDFMNNDMKADIVFTYAKIPNKFLKDCCIDLGSNSNLTSLFKYQTLTDFIAEDGSIYQLPLSSRLVGITYNETLMKEKGWKLPKDFNDMLRLKKCCEEEGITFAITDVRYSGNPFNYLFHLMGSQWISTVKGTVWLEGFLNGTKTLSSFKEQALYFKKWTESGLFGEFVGKDKNSRQEFGRRRALFLYSNRNNSRGYSGPQYDKYGNKTGVMLNDIFRSMPWISEDGSNNCFTVNENCWVMVNQSLADKSKHDKLAKVLKVLEYMMGEKYVKMMSEEQNDIFTYFNDFEIGEDRMYYQYADHIRRGFLQPWYYGYFDEGTIIATGSEIGSYMFNATMSSYERNHLVHYINFDYNRLATFDSAIGMLRNSLHSQQEDYLGWAEELIECPKITEMVAIACGMALQEQIDTAEVSVGLMPYADSWKELQPWKPVSVQNARAFPGVLQKAYSYIFEPFHCSEVVGIWMTGKQIADIVANKYDPSCYFVDDSTGESTFDSEHYGPYPYACAIKGNLKLKDNKQYLVAVAPECLEKEVFEQFKRDGKVIISPDTKDYATADIAHGITLYFGIHPTISNSNIEW